MIKKHVNLVVLIAVCLGMAVAADAQRGRSRRTPSSPQKSDSTQAKQQVTNSQAPVKYNPYGNVPIIQGPKVGGFSDSTKPSLRTDGAFEKPINNRTPLPYENLRPDDALYNERVWREIDTREKINQVFRFKAEDDNGDQRFVSILVKAIKEGKLTAFDPVDDRFTTPLDSVTFDKALNGGNACDTNAVYSMTDPTKIDHYVVNCSSLDPDAITKFRIKEDWVFDRESSRMFVRIIGIAPLKTIYQLDGKTERGTQALFWVYYPDLRPTLARYEVYNPKNMGQSRMTWEELFESRMFGSYIVKSTIDNPQNKIIKQYIKDPILALLEGDNIKEKIFNYEQDLWSY